MIADDVEVTEELGSEAREGGIRDFVGEAYHER